MGFTYNGTHSDAMGVVVTGIRRDILPPIAARTIMVPGRPGAYWQGHDYEMRKIVVEVFVPGASLADLRAKVRAIADWLKPDGGPKPLVFDDEDKQYYAVLSEETELEQILWYGRGELTFVCPDPHAYGTTWWSQVVNDPENPANNVVYNAGTATTYPIITATALQPVTYLAITTADKQVILGKPDGVGDTIVSPEVTILYDQLTSLNGWGAGVTVDGGVIAGAFQSDGTDLRVQSYGTGTTWHGPAVKKTLAEQLQDFRVTVWLTLNNKSKKVGRLECYLLDANDAVIGKVAMLDKYTGVDDIWAEARAGAWGPGHYFVNTHGLVPGVWNNFHGVMQIERRGNVWSAFFGRYDYTKKQFHTRWSAQFVDVANQYSTPKLAAIQLHAGQYGTVTVADMWFNAVIVKKLQNWQPAEVPNIAETGDVFIIDCERAAVYKNGYLAMDLLDISSEFIALPPKTGTTIAVAPDGAIRAEVAWRERWL